MVHHNKKQKGGKILGTGRDGCVVTPPLMCSSTMSKLNKISKLINVTDVSSSQYQDYVNEYESGKIFRKYDPQNLHFLPGIDMCEISENDANITTSMKKDIEKCGYKKSGKQTYMLNIIMKKGTDFPKITKNLNEKDFLKSLAYILTGAKKCIYDMNILLLDIKGPNLLYSKDDGDDDIYPVFIDFSDDFVIKNKRDFFNFIKSFGRRQLPYYDTWSFEILVLFYSVFIAHNDINTTENDNMINNYFDEIKYSRGIDLETQNGGNMMSAVIKYVNDNTKTLNGLYGVYNKIMMYSIGKTYYRVFIDSKIRDNKNIKKILLGLIDEDIHSRFYADDCLEEIGKYIGWKNRGQLLISPKTKTLKKKVDKQLQIKKLLAQAVKAQNKKKKSPPLPANLRMTPMSPLSFRQHVSQKPRKIIKKKKKIIKKVPSGEKSKPLLYKKSKSVSSNCMKMKLTDIKKTKKYKTLPRALGKSKLKKAELCALLQKKTGKSIKEYSKMTRVELLDIIQNKKNC